MAEDTQGWTVVEEPRAAAPATAGAPSGTTAGLTVATLAKLSPKAAWELMRFGTSPTAAKTGGAIANAATTLAAAGHGVMTGNPSQIIAAPLEGWAAGKGGYFGTKALQGAARTGAAVLEKAAPVLDAAGIVQGGLDLAQMAEPDRKDIGFFGVGRSIEIPKDKLDGIYISAVENGIKQGQTPAKAAAIIAKGDPKVFGDVMAAYMKSRMVK